VDSGNWDVSEENWLGGVPDGSSLVSIQNSGTALLPPESPAIIPNSPSARAAQAPCRSSAAPSVLFPVMSTHHRRSLRRHRRFPAQWRLGLQLLPPTSATQAPASATVTSGSWGNAFFTVGNSGGTGSLLLNGGAVSSAFGYIGRALGHRQGHGDERQLDQLDVLSVGNTGNGSLVINGGAEFPPFTPI